MISVKHHISEICDKTKYPGVTLWSIVMRRRIRLIIAFGGTYGYLGHNIQRGVWSLVPLLHTYKLVYYRQCIRRHYWEFEFILACFIEVLFTCTISSLSGCQLLVTFMKNLISLLFSWDRQLFTKLSITFSTL